MRHATSTSLLLLELKLIFLVRLLRVLLAFQIDIVGEVRMPLPPLASHQSRQSFVWEKTTAAAVECNSARHCRSTSASFDNKELYPTTTALWFTALRRTGVKLKCIKSTVPYATRNWLAHLTYMCIVSATLCILSRVIFKHVENPVLNLMKILKVN